MDLFWPRFLNLIERATTLSIVGLLCVMLLAFGGGVWWAGPLAALGALVLLLLTLTKSLVNRRFPVLKSPVVALWMLAMLLGLIQLAPLPGSLAGRLSARARSVHALGILPGRMAALAPAEPLPHAGGVRTPATLDRPATLRWLAGAACCLIVFWVVSQHVDRLNRTLALWSGLVGCLFVTTLFGVVQVTTGAHALYGVVVPGSGPAWAPSRADLLAVPNQTELPTPFALDGSQSQTALILPHPETPAAIGGLMGGPGAFLGLGALGLPLAYALALHLILPRSPRERLGTRLRTPGRGGLAILLLLLTLISTALVGTLAGPWLSLPLALGFVLVGLFGSRAGGQARIGLAATSILILTLAAGVSLGNRIDRPAGGSPLAAGDASAVSLAKAAWIEGGRIARDYPLVGAGLGAYSALEPYYKDTHIASTTAWSTLLQWWAETGLAGLLILGLALLWTLVRLPGALRRVAPADRTLAWGLAAAVITFAAFSVIHWTTDLFGIALAASAILGGCERWLAGGTDLFVERA